MLDSILQFLYDFTHWQYFGILAIIWVVADLVWIERWKSLIGRAAKLISKPLIFKIDEDPNDPRLYPRTFLEQLALSTKPADSNEANPRIGWLNDWMTSQRSRVFDPQNPLRSAGNVISTVLFVFFLLADTIVIANSMVLMGLMDPNLPEILKRLDIAFVGGAVLTAVVGVWMLIEMLGKGELINNDLLTNAQKKLLRFFATVVTLLSIVVMLALAVRRMIDLGFLEASPTMNLILSFVLYGLLAINNSFSAALTFQPGLSGLVVLIYLLFVIFPVLAFIFDLLGRPIYVIIDMVVWILLTPIIAIPHWIGEVIKMFTNSLSEPEDGTKK